MFSTVIVCRLVQFLNASSPISVTLLGISIDVRPVQPSNALFSIFVIVLGKLTSVISSFAVYIPEGTFVIPSPNVILVALYGFSSPSNVRLSAKSLDISPSPSIAIVSSS